MAVAFSSSAEEVLQRGIQPPSSNRLALKSLRDEQLKQSFEIKRCADWITTRSLRRVALQFPDEQLPCAVRVTHALAQLVPDVKLYVVGDTSFGSCCVDEVAAEHAACDGIIHFGHTCLSPPSRLKALLIMGDRSTDWTPLATQVVKITNSTSPPTDAAAATAKDEFLVLVDTEYCSQIDKIRAQLPSNAIIGVPILPTGTDADDSTECKGQHALRRVFPTERPLTEFSTILWIGSESQAFVNFLLRFNFAAIWAYDPESATLQRQGLTTSRSLMRRYYLVEKARDARIIGILVGTLGVRNYLQAIGHLKQLIRKAGRKSYTLAVGKLNAAKLANFQEIDIYVYVACPENSFFDSKEFYRPVVTPYELEVALNPSRQWGSDYFTDFNDILPGGPAYVTLPPDLDKTTSYDVSLISGRLRTLGNESCVAGDDEVRHKKQGLDENQLIERDPAGTVAIAPQVRAGQLLAERSWRGLDPTESGITLPAKVQPGRAGIAMGYQREGE